MVRTILFLFVLMMVACLSQFSSDVYAPALPSIAHDLNANIAHVQQTMAIYMLGIALVQVFYGPLSEAYGRRPPLMIGAIVMLLGSVLCMFANTLGLLMTGRFIQGCGAGAATALWRPMFRDRYSGADMAKYGGYLTIFISFFIPAAPAIGGYLEQYIGWRSIFVLITAYAAVVLCLVVFCLDESNTKHHKDKLRWPYIRESFSSLLRDATFIRSTFCTFLTYGAYFTLYIVSPILAIQHLGMRASDYGLALLVVSCAATLAGGYLNGKLVLRLGIKKMLYLAFSLILFSGCGLLASYYLMGVSLIAFFGWVCLFQFSAMLVFPNIFAKAFENVGHIAGYAGAIYSLMQIGGAAVIGWLAAYLPDHNQVPLAWVIITVAVLGLLVFDKTELSTSPN